MLEQLSKGNRVVGLKQSRKAVEGKAAMMVFVAGDADERLKSGFLELCVANKVPVYHVRTMAELGRACKIDIGAGFAALLK